MAETCGHVVNKTYTKHLLYIKSSSLSIHHIILYPSFSDATLITGLHQKQLRSYTKQRDGETAPAHGETAQGTHGAHGTPEIHRVRRRPQTAPRWTSRCRRTSRFPWETAVFVARPNGPVPGADLNWKMGNVNGCIDANSQKLSSRF